jgi:hypothetical protein
MASYLILLLVLACPLMMFLMMRGGHGHGGHGGRGHSDGVGPASIDDLRRRRDELDDEIVSRERSGEDAGHARVVER